MTASSSFAVTPEGTAATAVTSRAPGRAGRAGFDTMGSETPITPVMFGDEKVAQDAEKMLWEEGVYALAIVFPTVGKGLARVRTIVTADHTEADLAEALEVFARVGSELGLR